MKITKVCMLAGETGPKEYSQLVKYAREGCQIALMDRNKKTGQLVKKELEKVYGVPVFFFHGDSKSEEDRELFQGAVTQIYGRTDFIICQNK